MTKEFTQKYTIVHTIKTFADGFEFDAKDWPLHITLADVFAINGSPENLLSALSKQFCNHPIIKSRVIADDWFGVEKDIHVMLIDRIGKLQSLHKDILNVLNEFSVVYNSPQFNLDGFRPHSTIKSSEQLHLGDEVIFDSITLIDMFPDENPYQRKVLGTVYFNK